MKHALFAFLVILPAILPAQPDTLWIPNDRTVVPYAVEYDPISMEAATKRIGRYSYDTSRVAVELDYKRGTPSGVYRAYFPDGRPLIFAVYGWGVLHGDWTEYDEMGNVALKGQYRQGERRGPWMFKQDGIKGHYKDGAKNGLWKYYEKGRVVRSEKYRKGELKRTRNY
jgi:antitoxin component YwqK of YwqJK toxin-antitoxin module